ncbi:MAG: hypothetical protein RL318_777 [Fibrobacterota bacterium]
MKKVLLVGLFVGASLVSARSRVAEVRARLKQATTLEMAWVQEMDRCESDLYKIGMEVPEGIHVSIRCLDGDTASSPRVRFAVRVCDDQGLCRFADEEFNITDFAREGVVFEPFVPVKGR